MFEEMAKERMIEGGKEKGKTNSSNPVIAAQKAAQAVNVGSSIVKDAQFVRDHDPEAGRAAVFWLLWGCNRSQKADMKLNTIKKHLLSFLLSFRLFGKRKNP